MRICLININICPQSNKIKVKNNNLKIINKLKEPTPQKTPNNSKGRLHGPLWFFLPSVFYISVSNIFAIDFSDPTFQYKMISVIAVYSLFITSLDIIQEPAMFVKCGVIFNWFKCYTFDDMLCNRYFLASSDISSRHLC